MDAGEVTTTTSKRTSSSSVTNITQTAFNQTAFNQTAVLNKCSDSNNNVYITILINTSYANK